jgi:hypothetical protein
MGYKPDVFHVIPLFLDISSIIIIIFIIRHIYKKQQYPTLVRRCVLMLFVADIFMNLADISIISWKLPFEYTNIVSYYVYNRGYKITVMFFDTFTVCTALWAVFVSISLLKILYERKTDQELSHCNVFEIISYIICWGLPISFFIFWFFYQYVSDKFWEEFKSEDVKHKPVEGAYYLFYSACFFVGAVMNAIVDSIIWIFVIAKQWNFRFTGLSVKVKKQIIVTIGLSMYNLPFIVVGTCHLIFYGCRGYGYVTAQEKYYSVIKGPFLISITIQGMLHCLVFGINKGAVRKILKEWPMKLISCCTGKNEKEKVYTPELETQMGVEEKIMM